MKRQRSMRVEAHGTGFSLVELLIVTSLMAILLTMAVPAYREQGARAHRSIAVTKLLRAAACQARRRAQSGHYDTGACRPGASERYAFQYQLPGNAQADEYTLMAVPLGPQEADHCGWLSLDHTGYQQVEHLEAGRSKCWSGR